MEVEASKAVHVGDDKKADKAGANAVGINCWYLTCFFVASMFSYKFLWGNAVLVSNTSLLLFITFFYF